MILKKRKKERKKHIPVTCLKCSKRIIYSGNDSQHGGHEENADWLHEHYENDAKGPFGKKQTLQLIRQMGILFQISDIPRQLRQAFL